MGVETSAAEPRIIKPAAQSGAAIIHPKRAAQSGFRKFGQ
tara:strand:- start:355 stop:474 length:120 start_codon:yes stop_codon:yes gene_type:complete